MSSSDGNFLIMRSCGAIARLLVVTVFATSFCLSVLAPAPAAYAGMTTVGDTIVIHSNHTSNGCCDEPSRMDHDTDALVIQSIAKISTDGVGMLPTIMSSSFSFAHNASSISSRASGPHPPFLLTGTIIKRE